MIAVLLITLASCASVVVVDHDETGVRRKPVLPAIFTRQPTRSP